MTVDSLFEPVIFLIRREPESENLSPMDADDQSAHRVMGKVIRQNRQQMIAPI